MADQIQTLDFTNSPVAESFYYDQSPDALICGPIMSGKTYCMFARAFRHISEQPPGRDGVSRSRIAVVRHSYRALRDTCLPSYAEIFNPSFFGAVQPTSMSHRARFRLAGFAHEFELETLFRALEDEKDIRGLLSLNLSFAVVNEIREANAEVYGMLRTRVDRFPTDVPPKFAGVISDTNPFHDEHWAYKLWLSNKQPGYELFRQPSGLIQDPAGGWMENPAAENSKHRRGGYYTKAISGMDEESQRVYLRSEWGSLRGQRPVATYFNDSLHVREIEPTAGLPFIAGIDPGLQAATIIGQASADGFRIFQEVFTDGATLEEHIQLVKRQFAHQFPGQQLRIAYIDPAGDQRNAQTGATTTQAARSAFSPTVVMKAPGENQISLRIDSLQSALRQNNTAGQPMFLMHPRCSKLRRDLQSGWRYKEMKGSGGHYESKPYKLDDSSHRCDALCYLILGGGGGRSGAGNVDDFVRDCERRNNNNRPGKPWTPFHD
jgi:hypothetical protein